MSATAVDLDRLDELKGQFLAGLNHEIRTPLSGVLGMADLLLETKLDDEQRDYVEAARLCAETLLEVLNKTLEYSALSAYQVSIEEAEFPLREMLSALVEEFAPKAREKGLRLLQSFDNNLPVATVGDAIRLRQLISHVVSNAIKFTPRGEVEISASAVLTILGDLLLSVRVRDTGIGIPRDQLHTVFESFRQLESGLARRYNGLGLGLALARKLADLMRGRLEVQSEFGVGSVFTIVVPLRVSKDAPPPHAPEVGGRILVVDDDTVAQTITSHTLETHGFEVVCSLTGPEAIQAASAQRFGLILMDLQIPEMDGIEITRRLRQLPGYKETPILAVTANQSSEYQSLCFKRGMQGFLVKPVQPADLLAAVEKFVGPPGAVVAAEAPSRPHST